MRIKVVPWSFATNPTFINPEFWKGVRILPLQLHFDYQKIMNKKALFVEVTIYFRFLKKYSARRYDADEELMGSIVALNLFTWIILIFPVLWGKQRRWYNIECDNWCFGKLRFWHINKLLEKRQYMKSQQGDIRKRNDLCKQI